MSEEHTNSVIESPPEVRAFIYQQLSDIQLMLPDGCEIAVSVSPMDKESAITQAEIEIDTPDGQIYSLAKNKDQYDAIVAAKVEIEKQLKIMEDTYVDHEDEGHRDDLVDAIIDKRFLH